MDSSMAALVYWTIDSKIVDGAFEPRTPFVFVHGACVPKRGVSFREVAGCAMACKPWDFN